MTMEDVMNEIRTRVQQQVNVDWDERQHYYKFISNERNRVIAWVRKAKYRTTIFLRLEVNTETDLRVTPSTHAWTDSFPSTYRLDIRDRRFRRIRIDRAIELIVQSFNYDLTL